MSRLTNDLSFIQQAAQTSLVAFIKDALSVVAVFSVMLYLDWQMTLVILALCPIAILPCATSAAGCGRYRGERR